MCRRIVGVLVLCLFALSASPAPSLGGATLRRPETNIPRLLELSRQFEQKWIRGRDARYEAHLASTHALLKQQLGDPHVRLMYIDDQNRPVFHRYDELTSAQTVSTDEVWPGGAAGFALDGDLAGHAYLAQWDAGLVQPGHQEFGTRVVAGDSAGINSHATRVAGVMIAAGVNPIAIGMSPAAELYAFTSAGDDAEMALWATRGLRTSNHSYGTTVGWDLKNGTWDWGGNTIVSSTEDALFGKYTAATRGWDEIAYNAPYYSIVSGTGNDRGEAPLLPVAHTHGDTVTFTDTHPQDGGASGYDTITPTKIAKNILTVGGVLDIPGGWTTPSDVQMTTFSGWGPTDDGRIKPDVVANASQVTMPDTGSTTAYGVGTGCSFAGPAVAGSVNLMVQHWRATHGMSEILTSTVKALVIHTASEAGLVGPDYTFGWGLLDTRAAVELIDQDRGVFQDRIIEQTLFQAASDTVEFYWGDEAPFSVSMAWTDPPGSASSVLLLDDSTPKLVNDLDLRVYHVRSGAMFQPWVLNPANPWGSATRGDNLLDNVEQVRVDAPPTGLYRAIITHKGVLDSIDQTYSLIIPASRKVCLIPLAVMPPTWGQGPTVFQQFADLDSDSRLDLVFTDPVMGFRAFGGQAGGSFSRMSLGAAGSLGQIGSSVWQDFDNDGDTDALVGLIGDGIRFLRRDAADDDYDLRADSTCLGPNADPGCDTLYVIVAFDANADGRLDAMTASGTGSPRLRSNLGGLLFGSSAPPGLANNGRIQQIAPANIDGDARPEVFLANSDGPNKLFDAVGGGYVEMTIPGTGTASYDAAWGYLDNNNIPDLFVANRGEPDQLLLGTPGGFVLANLPQGDPDNGARPGVTMADFDLDGDVDVLLTHRGRILINNGQGVFSPGPQVPSDAMLAATWADLTRDGFPDLMLMGPAGGLLIHNNSCSPNVHWLELDLQGTDSPRSATGAIVTVNAGPLTQRRQVGTGHGARTQGPPTQHFGLGPAMSVDVRVDWPSGRVTQMTGVSVDRVMSIVEPASVSVTADDEAPGMSLSLLAWSNPMKSRATLEYRTSAEAAVRLELMSVDGRIVRRLVDARREPGTHRVVWDGLDDRGRAVANGVYFGLLRADGARTSARIIVAR